MPSYLQNLKRQGRKYKRPVFIPAALDDAGLSDKAFRVYCHLVRRADKQGRAWPQIRVLKRHCRGTLNSIVAAIRELESRCFIRIIHKRPAIYELTNSDQWVVTENCNNVVTGNRNYDVTGGVSADQVSEPIGEGNKVLHRKYSIEGTPIHTRSAGADFEISEPDSNSNSDPLKNPKARPSLADLKKFCADIGLIDVDADYINDRWNDRGFKHNYWQAYVRNLKRGGWTPSTRASRKAKRQPIRTRL